MLEFKGMQPIRKKFFVYTAKSIGAFTLASVAFVSGMLLYAQTKSPSLSREWRPDQAILPQVEWSEKNAIAHVKNIRDFTYYGADVYDIAYIDRTIRIGDVRGVFLYYIPYTFNGIPIIHTMLSFEFTEGDPLVLSVETRREVGEDYSLWRGFFREYEIIYIFGTEWDLVRKRIDVWGNEVYKYPLVGTDEQHEALLHNVLSRIDEQNGVPVFYNSLLHTCTTTLIDEMDKVYNKKPSKTLLSLWPQKFDTYMFWSGLIDMQSRTHNEFRDKGRIDVHARKHCPQQEGYSSCISTELVP